MEVSVKVSPRFQTGSQTMSEALLSEQWSLQSEDSTTGQD